MGTLTSALRDASNEPDDRDYVRKTKAAMIGAIHELDSTAIIKDTGWFNHSAMPDLVLSWPKRSEEREVYIRSSHEGIAAAHDIERLAGDVPVIIAVESGDETQREVTESALEQVGRSMTQPLVADAASFDTLTAPRDAPRASPLATAVSSHLLPSGHGLLTEDRADTITSPTPEVLESLEALLAPTAFRSVVAVAEIVAAATMKEGILSQIGPSAPFGPSEARDLLPWLLGGEVTNQSDEFWQAIADRTDLEVLESIADDLAGIDLTRICLRVLDRWSPRRGSLGLSIPHDRNYATNDGWFMEGSTLTRALGAVALRLASSGRRRTVQERGSFSSATWVAVRAALSTDVVLRSIVLRGLERNIRVGAEESADVKGDVDAIHASVEDQYYVGELEVAYGSREEDRRVRAVMGDRIVENLGSATMGDMLDVLANVVAYRGSIELEELADRSAHRHDLF